MHLENLCTPIENKRTFEEISSMEKITIDKSTTTLAFIEKAIINEVIDKANEIGISGGKR